MMIKQVPSNLDDEDDALGLSDVKGRRRKNVLLVLVFHYRLVKILLHAKSLLCTIVEDMYIHYLLWWMICNFPSYFEGLYLLYFILD